VKDSLVKDVIGKENYMLGIVSYFKDIFQDLFVQGLPSFWNDQGVLIPDEEYQSFKKRGMTHHNSIILLLI